jgi:hypothetical protein
MFTMTRSDAQVTLSAILLSMLSSLHLAQRAQLQGMSTIGDSSIRNAFISSTGEMRFIATETDAVFSTQMNYVTEKLQKAVDAINVRSSIPAAVLEAAIAIIDAEAVISEAPPDDVFTGLLEDISSMYLSPETLV